MVGQVEPSDAGLSEFKLDNVDKTTSLEYVIAGERASFEFVVPAGIRKLATKIGGRLQSVVCRRKILSGTRDYSLSQEEHSK